MSLSISMELQLPRDNATVPIVRHILRTTLEEIRVIEECVADVELAVTEACANVIEHADGEDAYQVKVSVAQQRCEISIIDNGDGFQNTLADGSPSPDAEHGRGLLIMQALMDSLTFESEPEDGTVVRLTKALEFEGSVI